MKQYFKNGLKNILISRISSAYHDERKIHILADESQNISKVCRDSYILTVSIVYVEVLLWSAKYEKYSLLRVFKKNVYFLNNTRQITPDELFQCRQSSLPNRDISNFLP